MAKVLHILHLEDSALDAQLVAHELNNADLSCRIDWVDNYADYLQALTGGRYDLILSDFSLPDCDGMKAFDEAGKHAPETPFLLVTGALGEERAIDTIKTGVTDYVLKTNLLRLQTAVPKAIETARAKLQNQQAIAELRLSEQRFDLAVRGSGAGIWDWADVSVEQMWWSPRIYEILGFDDGEIPASCSQFNLLLHPDDLDYAKQLLKDHFAGLSPYDVELRVRHKSGDYVWIRSRGQAAIEKDGNPTRMAGYVQDISDRKLAQKDLRAREADLLHAQQVAHIGSWSLDLSSGHLRWTDETYRIFGFDNHADFDETVEAFMARVHPDDRERVMQAWTAALAGANYDLEHRVLLSDGEVRHVREIAEVEYDVKSQPVKVIGVAHDLTEQRRAEEEKRKVDEAYRIVSATAQEAIVMINAAGLVTFWNPAAEKIFGYSADEIHGREIHPLLASENVRPLAMKGISHFSSTGEGPLFGKTTEIEGLTKQGDLVPLELSINRVFHDNEWQAIGILRDISERRQAEAQRLELEQQLRQTQKMEAVGTLAGGIAHDFNNILAAILGYSTMVERRLPLDSREKKDMQEVLKAAERAKQLVRQILTFSRMSELEKQPVSLDLVLKEVLQLLRASLPATIDIVTRLQGDGETILGDATQLHQVLMNLCTNAYHAMPKGGTLTIELKKMTLDEENSWGLPADNYLELLVADTGTGIEPEIVDRIFDPYFTTKELDRGTGLGLSVVKGIVNGLGGEIGVQSRLGEGTSFRLLFPSGQLQDQAETAAAATAVSGGSERILFIDDELSLVQLGKEVLEGLGYRVTTQTSSLAALKLVAAAPQDFDLLITDQTMPSMTGIELAKRLKLVAPDLPVILCSGLKYTLDTEGISDTSICKVLLKTELIDRLPQLIRGVFDQ